MGDRWFHKAFGAHYPLLYKHRDTAEARRCLDLLPRLAPLESDSGQPILDLGCGDGRHQELLAQAGLNVVGLDLSAELLAIAKERMTGVGRGGLVRGDMRRLPFADGVFCSVLSLFTAFGYFESPAANLEPVREVGRVLAPGGHWYLDYFDGDHVRGELEGKEPQIREREMGPLTVWEEREFVAGSSVVTKQVTLEARPGFGEEAQDLGVSDEGIRYTEKVAVFTLAELDDMTAGAGLTRVASAGGYEGQPLGEGSRWILVFRKNPKDTIL